MVDKKFLVVEDSPTMRRIIVNSLKRFGMNNVVEAANGVEALEKLQADQFDVLITDWNMPEMDGKELVTRVRGMAQYKRMPILMITTRGMEEDVITAIKIGVNGYVVKPFTPDVLRKKVQDLLG